MSLSAQLIREWNADWTPGEWEDAIAAAMQQAYERATRMKILRDDFTQGCHQYVEAEEWVASIMAARARLNKGRADAP